MDEMRSQIRAAFEREQAANPPAPSLRRSIVQAVAAREPRRETGLQWLAVAAAVLLGFLVVTALMSSRLANRPVPVRPNATPSAANLDRDFGPPPASLPLFYVASPTHRGWYIAFDWTGAPRGTVKLAQPLPQNGGLIQAPDGSGFQVTLGGKGNSGYRDRLGQELPLPWPPPGARWADDSKHLCMVQMNPRTMMLTLETQLVGEAPREVAPIYRYKGDESSIDVAACSFKNGRAIVVRTATAGLTDMWAIQLSDGKLLAHTAYTSGKELGSVIASADATLIAESSSKSQGFIGGPTAPQTAVRRAVDGSVVATWDPSFEVLAFTADDSEALVATTPWVTGTETHVALVQVATGRVLWRGDEKAYLSQVLVEPVGAGFALLFQDPNDSSLQPSVYVVMVAADGRVSGIPGRFVRP